MSISSYFNKAKATELMQAFKAEIDPKIVFLLEEKQKLDVFFFLLLLVESVGHTTFQDSYIDFYVFYHSSLVTQ